MQLPFFYIKSFDTTAKSIVLDEDTSKHTVQVLRMREGDKLNLTDGKGNLITAEITTAHKKKCTVQVIDYRFLTHDSRLITIAISLLKNASRFEWFLEKATEIGVNEIIPLICERTEKEKFRHERMQGILVSAMLQSQQVWLPVLQEPKKISQTIRQSNHQQKFIAHCMDEQKRNLSDLVNESLSSQIILIGPEGDFTKLEINLAIHYHFDAVTLGNTRLRSETAGVVAAALLRHV